MHNNNNGYLECLTHTNPKCSQFFSNVLVLTHVFQGNGTEELCEKRKVFEEDMEELTEV